MKMRRYRLSAMVNDPGSRHDTLTTDDGCVLETAWSGPTDASRIAVLTHPHPRFGGDMDNVVPATLARVLPEHGIATLRFNFRGAGHSTGTHGDGEAEVADVVAAIDAAAIAHPDASVVAVGYSFGADVLLAVDDSRLAAIVAVAPPLAVLALARLRGPRGNAPTLLLSAEHDQFRSADDARAVSGDWPATVHQSIAGTDHFLAGAVDRVADAVVTFLTGL